MVEGGLLATCGAIGGVAARSYAREPIAYIDPLHQLPKAGRQDIDNASVRVPAHEGFQEVIAIQVNPAGSSPNGSIMVFGKEDNGQKFHAVDQRSVAK